MKQARRTLCRAGSAVILSAIPLFAQPTQSQDPAADLLRQGQQKMRDGKTDEALAIYRQALLISPRSFSANNQLGVALDLTAKYADARGYFAKAIEIAGSPQQKAQAQRSMAMSYAFESDCANAAKYEMPVYDMYLADKDFYNAGEIADELARVCIDAGRLDEAAKWYQTGHDAGLREPDIKPDRRDLWDFRWEHAQARIAAGAATRPRRRNTSRPRKRFSTGARTPSRCSFSRI